MPTVYLKKDSDGKVLLVGGKVALHADCCCGEAVCCTVQDLTISCVMDITKNCGGGRSIRIQATCAAQSYSSLALAIPYLAINGTATITCTPDCAEGVDEDCDKTTDVVASVTLSCPEGKIGLLCGTDITPGASCETCDHSDFTGIGSDVEVDCEDAIGTHILVSNAADFLGGAWSGTVTHTVVLS